MIALALVLSGAMGVVLGLLGGGGSILTTPILLYVMHMEPKEAIASSLVVVGTTSFAGTIYHARSGNVDWKTGISFSGAGMVGAFTGGYLARFVSPSAALICFALMMLATAGAMFRGRKDRPDGGERAPTIKIVVDGFFVGALTGFVGAGGGFMVVSALTLLGGLPMKRAIGTSLFVITVHSFAGFLGHASHASINLHLIGMAALAAVLGSFVGTYYASRVPGASLRKAFAGMVLVMGVLVLSRELL